MKKLFLTLIPTTALLISKANFTAIPYYSYTKYSDDFKDEANGIGLFSSIYNYPHKLDFEIDYTNIKFKNYSQKYEQTEMTAVYGYFLNSNLFLKTGLHFVASDYKPSNEGLAAIITGAEYKKESINYGLELFYSNYAKYKPKALKVVQVHPFIKKHFQPKNKKIGNFDIKADLNYIKANNSNLYQYINSSYSSIGLNLTHNINNFSTSIFGWMGKRAFALEDGGFTLYNSNQEYNKAYGLKVKYKIKNAAFIELKYKRKKYKNYQKTGYSNGITTAFSYTW